MAGAMSVEAMRGTEVAFDREIHDLRPHPGQVYVAKRMRAILMSGAGGTRKKSEIAKSHENCGKVQDPYSLRCIPQVHGASRDALTFVRQVIEREINSVTDNPLVFPDQKRILSGGNFHGQAIAIAMDLLSIAMAEIASISEQRIEKLVNPVISDLPAFLTPQGGLNSGFMICASGQRQALCLRIKPFAIRRASIRSQHRATKKTTSAWGRGGREKQGLSSRTRGEFSRWSFYRPLKAWTSCVRSRARAMIEAVHGAIRKHVKKVTVDRPFHQDFITLETMLENRDFERLVAI